MPALTGQSQQWACLVRDCAAAAGRSELNIKGYIRPGTVAKTLECLGETTTELLSRCGDGSTEQSQADRERVSELIETALAKIFSKDVFSKAGLRAVAQVYGVCNPKTTAPGRIPRSSELQSRQKAAKRQKTVACGSGTSDVPGSPASAASASARTSRVSSVREGLEPVSADFNPNRLSFKAGCTASTQSNVLNKLKVRAPGISSRQSSTQLMSTHTNRPLS